VLIPFPIAFLYGAFFFDLVGLVTGNTSLWTTGAYLSIAGVVMGLVAAVPGLIDYLYTVPPKSTGKERATKHAIVNASSLVLFAISWFVRGGVAAPSYITLALQLAGLGLITAGGWMGGTMVYRNQIGVDPRYANAGKWREKDVEAQKGKPTVVAKADELKPNQMELLHVDGKRIVLARTEEGYVAFDDRCSHRGGSLAGGAMICGTVQCPWHGSQFDVTTGAVKSGPAKEKIGTYKVEESEGEVRLIL
jgi:nitrite reductase/ring-hydroxylating ferredoxin subunit/uncharacterized membrane protein